MFGRRDRCLLVLSQLAGVPYKHLATLTAGDVTVADGTATITPRPARGLFVRPTTPCCVGRARSPGGSGSWTWPSPRSAPASSPRRSTKPKPIDQRVAASVPLDPGTGRSDPGGAVAAADRPMGCAAVPGAALTPHSLSRRVRDLLAGDLGAHRDLPVEGPRRRTSEADTGPGGGAGGVQPAGLAKGVESPVAMTSAAGGLAEELTDVDRRADELNRRAAALASGDWTTASTQRAPMV